MNRQTKKILLGFGSLFSALLGINLIIMLGMFNLQNCEPAVCKTVYIKMVIVFIVATTISVYLALLRAKIEAYEDTNLEALEMEEKILTNALIDEDEEKKLSEKYPTKNAEQNRKKYDEKSN